MCCANFGESEDLMADMIDIFHTKSCTVSGKIAADIKTFKKNKKCT
jgi:hypothetical protein